MDAMASGPTVPLTCPALTYPAQASPLELLMKLALQGSLTRDLPLPGLGSVRSFSGRRQDTEIFFSYTDFVTPGANYRCKHEL